MNTKTGGMVMLVIGVIGLIAVYSMLLPLGFGEALMMMGQRRQSFIREPLYQILLALPILFFLLLFIMLSNLNAS